MATKRKAPSKKTRFEVFKRDSFQCQYCGSKAPDVVLEVDHIRPVVNGGGGELMNLITSCFDCNRGKGKREISDSSVIEKQRKQIEELNERRQQLEMMMEWKSGVSKLKDMECESVCELVKRISKWNINDHGKKTIRKLIKKFGFQLVLDSTEDSFDRYYDDSENSWDIAFNNIEKIASYKSKPEHEQKIVYCLGILKNRFRHKAELDLAFMLMKEANKLGCDTDTLQSLSKTSWSFDDFISDVRRYIRESL